MNLSFEQLLSRAWIWRDNILSEASNAIARLAQHVLYISLFQ